MHTFHLRRSLRFPFALAFLGTVVGCSVAEESLQNAKPAPIPGWEEDIRRFEESDRQSPPPADAALFVGSSSIRMWTTLAEDFEGVPVLNRGFGGSEYSDIIDHAERIVIPYQPRWIVLYSGDNDLVSGKKARRIASDAGALAALFLQRIPEAKIAFVSIKPSPARWHLHDEAVRANAEIAKICEGNPRLAFIDVYSPMLDSSGEPREELFLEDGLHLNAAGYALWRERVAPFLR